MLLKKALLSQENLNNAFLSKTSMGTQVIESGLTISGGILTLKNTVITDNANSGYLRIDPQGNAVIIYDGVNNQKLSIFSSSGSEALELSTINQPSNKSFALIDVMGTSVDHIEIGTNSSKPTIFSLKGIAIGNSATRTDNFVIQSDTGSGARGLRIYNGIHGDATHLLTLKPDGKVGIGREPSASKLEVEGEVTVNGGWLKTTGNYGWQNSTWGGGFYMADATWLRTLGGKNFYHDAGIMRTDGTLQVGQDGSTLNVPNGGPITANKLMSHFAPIIERGSDYAVYTHRNLARYYMGGTGTGCFVIQANWGKTATMFQAEIEMYLYSIDSAFTIKVGGYDYTTGAFINYSYAKNGGRRNIRVRLGRNASGHMCIILGSEAESWSYPAIFFRELVESYSGVNANHGSGWTISMQTSLAGYTNLTEVSDNSGFFPNALVLPVGTNKYAT